MNQAAKILIIQLRRIGDVVFTLPIAELLRKNFPDAQIDFLVEEPADQLVRLNPGLNQTLVYEKLRAWHWISEIRKRRYDCVLDFHAIGRSLILTYLSGAKLKVGFDGALSRKFVYNKKIQTDRNKFIVEQKMDLLGALGIKDKNWKWNLNIPEPDLRKVEIPLENRKIAPSDFLIGFAPLHRHFIRAWKRKYFAETAKLLIEKFKVKILLLGGPGEEEELYALEKTIQSNAFAMPANSLIEMASLIKKCKLIVANDNGPQKIAMALSIPSLTIFGPTNPGSISLNQFPHISIRDEKLFCIGCELSQCPYKHECMENVTPAMVLKKIEEIMAKLNV